MLIIKQRKKYYQTCLLRHVVEVVVVGHVGVGAVGHLGVVAVGHLEVYAV